MVQKGQCDKALRGFSKYRGTPKRKSLVSYYSAVCLINLKRYKFAEALLKRAKNLPPRLEAQRRRLLKKFKDNKQGKKKPISADVVPPREEAKEEEEEQALSMQFNPSFSIASTDTDEDRHGRDRVNASKRTFSLSLEENISYTGTSLYTLDLKTDIEQTNTSAVLDSSENRQNARLATGSATKLIIGAKPGVETKLRGFDLATTLEWKFVEPSFAVSNDQYYNLDFVGSIGTEIWFFQTTLRAEFEQETDGFGLAFSRTGIGLNLKWISKRGELNADGIIEVYEAPQIDGVYSKIDIDSDKDVVLPDSRMAGEASIIGNNGSTSLGIFVKGEVNTPNPAIKFMKRKKLLSLLGGPKFSYSPGNFNLALTAYYEIFIGRGQPGVPLPPDITSIEGPVLLGSDGNSIHAELKSSYTYAEIITFESNYAITSSNYVVEDIIRAQFESKAPSFVRVLTMQVGIAKSF